MSITHGLIIREPWIGLILQGLKTWEMRSRNTQNRGLIALIRAGTSRIVGVTEIVDSRGPLSDEEMRATYDFHRIPADKLPLVISKRWVNAWELRGTRQLAKEIPYKHTAQVSWVKLDPFVSFEVERLATN